MATTGGAAIFPSLLRLLWTRARPGQDPGSRVDAAPLDAYIAWFRHLHRWWARVRRRVRWASYQAALSGLSGPRSDFIHGQCEDACDLAYAWHGNKIQDRRMCFGALRKTKKIRDMTHPIVDLLPGKKKKKIKEREAETLAL